MLPGRPLRTTEDLELRLEFGDPRVAMVQFDAHAVEFLQHLALLNSLLLKQLVARCELCQRLLQTAQRFGTCRALSLHPLFEAGSVRPRRLEIRLQLCEPCAREVEGLLELCDPLPRLLGLSRGIVEFLVGLLSLVGSLLGP